MMTNPAFHKRRTSQSGITLIEMLVVVTIIALFVGLVGVNVLKQGDKARVVTVKAEIESLENALTLYKLDTGTFPPSALGLHALREKPDNVANWAGPYLAKDVPNDAWNRPYIYKYPGDHGEAPDLVSLGADGQPGGEGYDADIVSWSNK
jgi:general secretion pathway protein G